MKQIIELELRKETKGTLQFKAVNDNDCIDTIYINKECGVTKKNITVTVEQED